MPVSFTSHFILSPGPFIISHHHKRKSLYSTLRYFEKEHIYLIRITVYHHLSISLLVLVAPYLLCLTHKLNFIISQVGSYRKKHSTYRVQFYLWFQPSPMARGNYSHNRDIDTAKMQNILVGMPCVTCISTLIFLPLTHLS